MAVNSFDTLMKNRVMPLYHEDIITKGPWVDVRAHGVLGDSSDQTTNIQAAIDDASAGSRIYFPFPSSKYKVTSPLTVNKALTFSGDYSEIHQATSNTKLFVVTASDVHFKNLKLTGPQFTVSQSLERAIDATGTSSSAYVSNVTVKDCIIKTWGFYGIYFQFVEDFDVSGNIIDDIYSAGFLTESARRGSANKNKIKNLVGSPNSWGIALTRVEHDSLVTHPRSSEIDVTRNVVRDAEIWEAYDTHGGERIRFIGNSSYNVKKGLVIGPSDNGSNVQTFAPLDITVFGNTFDSGVTDGSRQEGISFTGAITTAGSPTQLATGSIVGNTLRGFGDKTNSLNGGMRVHTTQGLVVSGNSIIEPSPHGLNFDNDNYDFSFTGNTVTDPWADSGNASGVALRSDYNHGIISGNVFAKDAKSASVVLNIAILNSIATNSTLDVGLNRSEAGIYVSGPSVIQNYGQDTFATSGTKTVSFNQTEGSASYRVNITGNVNETFWVTSKLTTGFTLNSSNASSVAVVDWEIIRR